jgi:predicted anti-sigma-YlaC factor YlaD
MYANAFLYTPATMLTESRYKEQEFLFKRAKNLYLRGRDILLQGLDKRHKGFLAALNQKQYDLAFKTMKKEDVPFLYWAGAGWLGAFAIDPFDMDLGISMPKAAALMDKVKQLDEGFGNGAIHEFYALYYGSLPDYMGGDVAKTRYHFQKALEISAGKSTSAYLALATTVCVKEQDVEEFKAVLAKALEVNPDLDLDNRLLHTLNQRRARWLLDHIDDFFLLEEVQPGNEEKLEKNLEGI